MDPGGLMILRTVVRAVRSARRLVHGVDDEDIRRAAENQIVAYTIDDNETPRELRLGFDTRGRLLEIVVLLLDDDTEVAIHA